VGDTSAGSQWEREHIGGRTGVVEQHQKLHHTTCEVPVANRRSTGQRCRDGAGGIRGYGARGHASGSVACEGLGKQSTWVTDRWARRATRVNGQMGRSGSARVQSVKEELISEICLTFFNQH
jgi:hypothetical protein